MAKLNNDKKSKLSNKYRFSISNDTTHEELFVFRSNGKLFLLTIVLAVIFLIVSVTLLISFTSLREFIPGYPSAQTRRELVQNALKLEALQNELNTWSLQLINIQRISQGLPPVNIDSLMNVAKVSADSLGTLDEAPGLLHEADSLLRLQVIKDEQLSSVTGRGKIEQIEGLHFFTPVRGIVTEPFNAGIGHPYVDIAAEKNSVVSSVLDGTVVSAGWTDESGYTIQIQHDNNLISAYKHNEKLLKKTGDKVSAGTPVALVGSTGKVSTGTHLHFELWHKGEPIDPAQYIKF